MKHCWSDLARKAPIEFMLNAETKLLFPDSHKTPLLTIQTTGVTFHPSATYLHCFPTIAAPFPRHKGYHQLYNFSVAESWRGKVPERRRNRQDAEILWPAPEILPPALLLGHVTCTDCQLPVRSHRELSPCEWSNSRAGCRSAKRKYNASFA